MRFTPGFYRTAAVLSLLSAVTTAMLIVLPHWYAPAQDLASRMARVQDPAYVVRAWTYLVHPFFVVAAALAVAARLRRVAASWVVPGFLAFALWGATEVAQQALTLFAYDPWRVAYLEGDAGVRAAMLERDALYSAVWNAMWTFLLLPFLVANALYAAALLRRQGLSLAVGAFYAAAAALTALLLLREFGLPSLPEPVLALLYPALQPIARALIGVWLWRNADEDVVRDVEADDAPNGEGASRLRDASAGAQTMPARDAVGPAAFQFAPPSR
jgi:hypothetical protein